MNSSSLSLMETHIQPSLPGGIKKVQHLTRACWRFIPHLLTSVLRNEKYTWLASPCGAEYTLAPAVVIPMYMLAAEIGSLDSSALSCPGILDNLSIIRRIAFSPMLSRPS